MYSPDKIDSGAAIGLLIVCLANNGRGLIVALCIVVWLLQYATRHSKAAGVQWRALGVPDSAVARFVLPGTIQDALELPLPTRRVLAQEAAESTARISLPLDQISAPAAYYDDNPWQAPPATVAQPGTLRLYDIANGDNILVVGPKGSGKTTLLRALIRLRRGDHLALDPHNAPGKWPCDVVGGGRNFVEIDKVLQGTYLGLNRYYQLLNSGTVREGQFKRHTLVGDEWRAISQELPGERNNPAKLSAGAVLLKVLAEGRKVGLCMLTGAHNDTAASMGMAGDMAMLTCFDWIVYLGGLAVRKLPEAARLPYPAVAYHPERDTVALLDVSDAMHLAGPIVSSVPDTSIKQQAPILSPAADTGIGGIPDMHAANAGITADTSGIDREAKIRTMLAWGCSANAIYAAIGGNRNEVLKLIDQLKNVRTP